MPVFRAGMHPRAIRVCLSVDIRDSVPPPESLPCLNVQIDLCRAVLLDIVGAIIDRPRDFVPQNHIAARR